MHKHIQQLEKETRFFIRERALLKLLEATRQAMFKRMYTNNAVLNELFEETLHAINENRKEYERQAKKFESEKKLILQDRERALFRSLKTRLFFHRGSNKGSKTASGG